MHASEGLTRLDAAIASGRAAIDAAANTFQGTVPPRPWPSPELYDAIDDADALRDRLAAIVRGGDPDFDPALPPVAKMVKEVERRAVLVDTLAAKLSGRREVVATRTPERVIRDVKRAAFGIPKGLLVAAAVWWLLKELE